MDKNAIKKFAVWARRELIARVSQKALQFGIAAGAAEPADATSINGKVLSTAEVQQRRALLKQVQSKGYEQVMEEVAYTWFNRFCALRFMEVNQYLPSRVRVFTNEEDAFKPQMIDEALSLELEGLSMDAVYAYKEANDKEGLFKYLLITQCNALSSVLPQMFQHIADYTELLFPDNLLREGSVIHQMVTSIPTEDWQDAVQIIGWLYQFYISEKKDAVLAKKGKVTKEEVPARTQLFTPDWIVRYMVENSLGRLWVEGHPNEELKQQWRYYLEEAEQEPVVQAQLADIRKEYAAMKPEDIKCIDPCCGSGHILAYMFDVLVQIYESCGYTTHDAVRNIVEKNIYGLDIDDRAAQLAYFTVMMKARQYDRRFLTRKDDWDRPDVPQPMVYEIPDCNAVDEELVDYFADGNAAIALSLHNILHDMRDTKECGSLISVTPVDFNVLHERFAAISTDSHVLRDSALRILFPIVQTAEALARKYDAVVTNPPYMKSALMSNKLSAFVKERYSDYKDDLYSAFIVRCSEMGHEHAKLGFFSPYVWMFIQAYEELRYFLCQEHSIETLIQFEYSAFEEATVPVCTFVFANSRIAKKAPYLRLTSFRGGMEVQRVKTLDAIANPDCGYYYESTTSSFSKIPGSPIAYWVPESFIKSFMGKKLIDVAYPKRGFDSGDNDCFLRLWHEVSHKKIMRKWFYLNKGGAYRKWFGNNEYVVDWENDGERIKKHPGSTIRNPRYYFQEGVTWSKITSYNFSGRFSPKTHIFDSVGLTCFPGELSIDYLLCLFCSKVANYYLNVLNPTLTCTTGAVGNLPIMGNDRDWNVFSELCVNISRIDWDSFETSWDFKRHPLLRGLGSVQAAFEAWEREASERFYQLKANEEELNRIFIDIYGLQDELTPEVEEKDVTVRKADLARDIRSLISYAVGCMFGRYSLDVEGLAYAGGDWDASKYSSFPADADNIIPICDDEYFEDDIVGRFVEFIRVAYGANTLEENLRFIANALGGKGSAREVIRKYFRDDFYADHLKIYQKRPIYWQFDSGKKGGFRALVYMHRYAPDTIARIRTDYVHQQQDRYRTALEGLEQRMANASTGERVKLSKVQKKLLEQDKELHEYEEKIHHLADRFISIDLDDGVKKNYALFADVLTKIK